MDITQFLEQFERMFPEAIRNQPTYAHWDPLVIREQDLCPDVEGMLSIKKQMLLNLAFALLPEDEAYLEVGTYKGKSLLSALIGNPPRIVYACDDFSLFEGNTLETTQENLARYEFQDAVTFYNMDFEKLYAPEHLSKPIGLYFYDGAHDDHSQYVAIKNIEPFLADQALVLVDDWRFAPDSQSRAREATLRATAESVHRWTLHYELPARFNGDRAMWWNGVAILSFQRQ